MSAVKIVRAKRRKKAEGRRNGDVVTPHVYGFKRFVWGETFRFGHDKATATARCLRLLAFKSEQEGKGATAWTPETKAAAWRIARGQDEASASAATAVAQEAPPVDSGTLRALGYEVSPSRKDEAPEQPPAKGTKPTFYDALDAYAALPNSDHSFAGRVKAQRRALANLPLERIGARELTLLVRHWKSKPSGTRTDWVEKNGVKVPVVVETGQPLKAISVKKYVQSARQFFNWLASDDSPYAWDAPKGMAKILELTNADFESLKGAAERQSDVRAMNDPTALHFANDELKALYDACGLSQRRRLFFLLALNIGASTSELANLRIGDCYLDGDNAAKPFIAFVRHKTRRFKCYGKWFLWAETATALREWIAESKRTKAEDFVFLTEDGNELVTLSPGGYRNDSVKMVWKVWSKTAGVDRLSWKHLRKTASQFVRKAATELGLSGEYMAELFTAHASPVMSRHYNQRDETEYDALGRVLIEVRKSFEFLFAKVTKVSSGTPLKK